jgi:hypothetical protein
MEIIRICREGIRKGIAKNSDRQNNVNVETSENKWKNIKKVKKGLLVKGWDIRE